MQAATLLKEVGMMGNAKYELVTYEAVAVGPPPGATPVQVALKIPSPLVSCARHDVTR